MFFPETCKVSYLITSLSLIASLYYPPSLTSKIYIGISIKCECLAMRACSGRMKSPSDNQLLRLEYGASRLHQLYMLRQGISRNMCSNLFIHCLYRSSSMCNFQRWKWVARQAPPDQEKTFPPTMLRSLISLRARRCASTAPSAAGFSPAIMLQTSALSRPTIASLRCAVFSFSAFC